LLPSIVGHNLGNLLEDVFAFLMAWPGHKERIFLGNTLFSAGIVLMTNTLPNPDGSFDVSKDKLWL
jgi:hypothetical protein